METTVKQFLAAISLIIGLGVLTACPSSGAGGKNNASGFPTKQQIIGTYKSDDGSNVIVIKENSFEYVRTFVGKEGIFTFNITSPNWEIKKERLRFDCYDVTVKGNMSSFNITDKTSFSSNINSGATELAWVIAMIYENGKQTDRISRLLLATDDQDTWIFYGRVP